MIQLEFFVSRAAFTCVLACAACNVNVEANGCVEANGYAQVIAGESSAVATPTPSPTSTAPGTTAPTQTPQPTPSQSPAQQPTPEPTKIASPTPSPLASPGPAATPTPTVSLVPIPEPTVGPAPTPTPTAASVETTDTAYVGAFPVVSFAYFTVVHAPQETAVDGNGLLTVASEYISGSTASTAHAVSYAGKAEVATIPPISFIGPTLTLYAWVDSNANGVCDDTVFGHQDSQDLEDGHVIEARSSDGPYPMVPLLPNAASCDHVQPTVPVPSTFSLHVDSSGGVFHSTYSVRNEAVTDEARGRRRKVRRPKHLIIRGHSYSVCFDGNQGSQMYHLGDIQSDLIILGPCEPNVSTRGCPGTRLAMPTKF